MISSYVRNPDSKLRRDRERQRGCSGSVNRYGMDTVFLSVYFYSGCVNEAVIRVGTIALPAREPGLVGNT